MLLGQRRVDGGILEVDPDVVEDLGNVRHVRVVRHVRHMIGSIAFIRHRDFTTTSFFRTYDVRPLDLLTNPHLGGYLWISWRLM